MQALESFVYHHGFAYRYGGDEYIIILANVFHNTAIEFLNSLCSKIADLNYPGIKEKITISIGFCYVTPDCNLTNRALEKKANEAKNFAKKAGKNCVATFKDEKFETRKLYVVKP